MTPRRVEVIVFDGCPHADVTLERVRRAIEQAAVPAELLLVRVANEEHARRLRFVGSPTVRVDGIDVEPDARSRDDYDLRCRVYAAGDRLEGAPPTAAIVSALREASGRAGDALRARDLVSRPWARAAWCGLALVAFVGIFSSDLRALLWIAAFGASGVLCVANAIRSRRFHCLYTGPIYLAGAVATALRASGVITLSWTWIGAGVCLGVVGALVWERARRDPSVESCC